MQKSQIIQYVLFAFLSVTIGQQSVISQSKNTENTLTIDAEENRQKATIDDISWLSGSWLGEGFGGVCEEVWSAPMAKSMMGMFQMIQKDAVLFYELCQIVQDNESLILKLKHFNTDLTGWETKDETIDFPLLKIEGQTAWFDGITYQRQGDQLKVWVAIKEKDGVVSEGAFVFIRKSL